MFSRGNSVDPYQTLHYVASGWGLLKVFIGSFSCDKSISAGYDVGLSKRSILQCLIRVCILQVLFRIIELFSADSGGFIALNSHLVKYTVSQLEAVIRRRMCSVWSGYTLVSPNDLSLPLIY